MYDFKIQNVQLVCPQTNSMISTSTWGELNIVLNARRIELGTKLIFLHVWAKVMRRMQQPHSFHDSTCAIEPTGTPPAPKFKKVSGNVQGDFHFLVRQKSRSRFCQKRPTSWIMVIPENGFEAANTFFCRNHKSHLTSLCCRVSWDTVSFVLEHEGKL